MRKLIYKHPWILVVMALGFFMTLSMVMLVIALLNRPTIIPH
jgi:hypothetical protein